MFKSIILYLYCWNYFSIYIFFDSAAVFTEVSPIVRVYFFVSKQPTSGKRGSRGVPRISSAGMNRGSGLPVPIAALPARGTA